MAPRYGVSSRMADLSLSRDERGRSVSREVSRAASRRGFLDFFRWWIHRLVMNHIFWEKDISLCSFFSQLDNLKQKHSCLNMAFLVKTHRPLNPLGQIPGFFGDHFQAPRPEGT